MGWRAGARSGGYGTGVVRLAAHGQIRRHGVRSLAEQTVEELGGRWSILHRQKQDHVRLNDMMERLPSTEGDDQDELLNRI